jgi:predicted GNAT family acetyltransferase
MSTEVRDNPDEQRYELHEDGTLASFVTYRPDGDVLELVHTETFDGFEGRGLAGTLVHDTLDDLRRRGLQVRPVCPFVQRYLKENADYRDLIPEAERSRFGL